jgi:hypothetical protein
MIDRNPSIVEEYLALFANIRFLTTRYGYVTELATAVTIRRRGCTGPGIQLTEFGESTKEEVVEVTQRGREGRTSRTQLGGPTDDDHVLQLLKGGILGHERISLDRKGLLWVV